MHGDALAGVRTLVRQLLQTSSTQIYRQVGHSVDEAAWWFITMERSCQAQLLAEAAGSPVLIDPEQAEKTAGQVHEVTASDRFIARALLSTTLPVPSVPVVPPAPTCNVPALIVVVPVYVFVPLSVKVPAPCLVRAPVPLLAVSCTL